MGIGAVLVVIGIVLLIVGHWLWGLILAIIGLAFGGFRRGRWY
jgi:hypothetical protein